MQDDVKMARETKVGQKIKTKHSGIERERGTGAMNWKVG